MADQVELRVPPELDGERVDKVIATMLGISRARASVVSQGGVSLDGAVARTSDRVNEGQLLVCARPADVAELQPEPVDFGVAFEDPHVIVVDKPPGLVVHPGARVRSGTLAAGLIHRYPELVGVGQADRWGLVHRLDKDTSGLVLVARDQHSYTDLVGQLRKRRVRRIYQALVEGQMGAPTGTIDAPIGRDEARPTRRAVSHSGKPARTHFEVIEWFAENELSLLRLTLETGRTHQIRVHLASVGKPVVGDRTYGASRRNIASPRTFLHAAEIGFDHPFSGDAVTVESGLPDDLGKVLAGLMAQPG